MNLARSHNKVAFLPILALLLAMSPAGAASLPNFSDLVEKASPAVVNISTTQKSTVHSRLPEGMEIPPFSLVLGSPAKIKKTLTDKHAEVLRMSAAHYVENSRRYHRELKEDERY